MLLNRVVRPLAIRDMGIRALELRGGFDLVHVHAHPVRLFRRGDTPLVMSEGSSAAVYLRDYLGWDDRRLARGFRRARGLYRAVGIDDRLLALERVQRAYVFSRWAREINIHWGADPVKLDVIAPGFAVPPRVDRQPRARFTFLFVGTDFERKGGFDVVEAFARISLERPEAHLVLAGSDPAVANPERLLHGWVNDARRRQGLDLLARLTDSGHVSLLPWVSPDDLSGRLYPKADAFVMPSHAEGFGFTNVEAMSFGLPVITSDVGPLPEVVAHEQTGLIVPAGDVDALSRAMYRLVDDRDQARLLGERGRAEFEARYTIAQRQAALGDFYAKAVGG